MPYDDPKWHQHRPTPVETQVQIADMKARIHDVMIRETHVRVGDHDPEPRRDLYDFLGHACYTGRDGYTRAASKRAELAAPYGRAAQ